MPGGPAGPPTNNVRMFHLKFDIFQMSNLIFFKYLKYLEYPVYLKYPKYPAANPENLKFYKNTLLSKNVSIFHIEIGCTYGT